MALLRHWLKIEPGWKIWNPQWMYQGAGLGLVSILLVFLSSSLTDAHWVIDSSPVTGFLFAGLVFGFLLAHTRWQGWIVALYSMVLSTAAVIQIVEQVLPPLEVVTHLGLAENLGIINLRLFAFFERAFNWWVTYASGGKILDQGLFILTMSLVNWGLSVWMCWWVFRRWRGLEAMVPFAIVISLNVYYSQEPLIIIVYTIPVIVAVTAYTTFGERWSEWENRKIDFPYLESFLPEWSGYTLAAAFIITMLAWALALVATPQGWKNISDSIYQWRHQNDPPQGQLFSNLAPSNIPAETLWAHSPQVRVVGEPPSRKMDTVFLVVTDDPPPPPAYTGIRPAYTARQRYWRSDIYATYTGVGWDEAETKNVPPDEKPQIDASTYPPGRSLLTQQFYIVAEPDVPLFSANDPFQVGGANLVKTLPDTSILVIGKVRNYKVVSWVPNPSARELITAGTDYPPSISNTYLQLPDTLPKRVDDLAKRLTIGADTPYEKAVAIQDYLRRTYAYDLDVPPPAPNQDVVDYFLFYAQKGFCSYYASSMTVMLRSLGVPARLVTGYVNGDYDYKDHFYHVPLSNAHAWVEVYFPMYGWVEFEPTPSQPAYDYAALDQKQAEERAHPGSNEPTPPLSPVLPVLPWITLGLLLFGFFWGGWRIGRLFFTGKKDLTDRIIVLYARTQNLVAGMGVNIRPNSTPDEFLAQAAGQLQEGSHFAGFVESITALYRHISYMPNKPTNESMRQVEKAWGGALMDWERRRIVNDLRALWAKLGRK